MFFCWGGMIWRRRKAEIQLRFIVWITVLIAPLEHVRRSLYIGSLFRLSANMEGTCVQWHMRSWIPSERQASVAKVSNCCCTYFVKHIAQSTSRYNNVLICEFFWHQLISYWNARLQTCAFFFMSSQQCCTYDLWKHVALVLICWFCYNKWEPNTSSRREPFASAVLKMCQRCSPI